MAQDDKFGRHELLDRAYIIMGMIDKLILDHGGLKEDERQHAIKAIDELSSMYQKIGNG